MPDGTTPPTAPAIESGAAKRAANDGYIVGPFFDLLFFILSPAWWLALGIGIWALDWVDVSVQVAGEDIYIFPTFALTFTMAHIFAVFFRSHLNRDIFRLHPVRFTVVPLLLVVLFSLSEVAFICGLIFAVWFDNYHSSLQTFGLGRIYDMRQGNDPKMGRRLDYILALVVFMGPILSGVTFATGLKDFSRFQSVGLMELARFEGWATQHQLWLTVPILTFGVGFTVYYVYAYWRFAQQGYNVSWQKVALWAVLSVVSIYTWAFDSFGMSFLVMESFHSFQYFGLVWWSEKRTMRKTFRLENVKAGMAMTLSIFLAVSFAFGLWCALFARTRFEIVLFLVAEILHYWFDGFVWSVRKKQVK